MKQVLIIWNDYPNNIGYINIIVTERVFNNFIKWNNELINASYNQYDAEMNRFFFKGVTFKYEKELTDMYQTGTFDGVFIMGIDLTFED